jgi:hypothetical protein
VDPRAGLDGCGEYNYLNTDCDRIRGIHRRATAMSPALKQNFGGHRYQDDRALETVVTRWLITRGRIRTES